jgi:hypothetical protein
MSASPFRVSRNLSLFAFRLSLFSCHCFDKDAQFAAQGGITGFVLTVRGLDIGNHDEEKAGEKESAG